MFIDVLQQGQFLVPDGLATHDTTPLTTRVVTVSLTTTVVNPPEVMGRRTRDPKPRAQWLSGTCPDDCAAFSLRLLARTRVASTTSAFSTTITRSARSIHHLPDAHWRHQDGLSLRPETERWAHGKAPWQE
ncbi:hypothetical protein G6F68_018165 [Rhizopus microsporus]|nr:hypothetical protein G6F68_018165 [Rhizopus microsporus]